MSEQSNNITNASEQMVVKHDKNRIMYMTRGTDYYTWMFHISKVRDEKDGNTYLRFIYNHVDYKKIQKNQNPLELMKRRHDNYLFPHDLDFDIAIYGDIAHVMLLCGDKEDSSAEDIKTAVFYFQFKIGGSDFNAYSLRLLEQTKDTGYRLSFPRISANAGLGHYGHITWIRAYKGANPDISCMMEIYKNTGEAQDINGDFQEVTGNILDTSKNICDPDWEAGNTNEAKLGKYRIHEFVTGAVEQRFARLWIAEPYDQRGVKQLFIDNGLDILKLETGDISSLQNINYAKKFVFTWIKDKRVYICTNAFNKPIVKCFNDAYGREFNIDPNFCKFVSNGTKIRMVDLANLNGISLNSNDAENSYIEPYSGKTSVRVYDVDTSQNIIKPPAIIDLKDNPYTHFAGLIQNSDLRLIFSDDANTKFDVLFTEI